MPDMLMPLHGASPLHCSCATIVVLAVPTTLEKFNVSSSKRELLQSPATPLKVVHCVMVKTPPSRIPLRLILLKVTLRISKEKAS